MRIAAIALALLPMTLLMVACAATSKLDAVAERYVKLVLAVGRHDDMYVDAYYGPPAWKTEAERGDPVPLPELLTRARVLRDELEEISAGPADRKRFLLKQVIAIETHLRRLSGESMTLAAEARGLYDVEAPRHDVSEFAAAHAKLEALVPGVGPLGPRIEALRKAVHIPPAAVEKTLRLALDAARAATAPFVKLPATESFETVLVAHKPWGAYNWYLGNFKSRIELNTDLPTELNGLLGTMCHEGYPGHHVYNVLLEDRLVKKLGYVEFTVYPLYSPQSLLAEGSANVGIDVVFTDDEKRRVLTQMLGPAAGVPAEAILALDRLHDALEPLKYVRGEATRMLLDDGVPEDQVVAFVERWALINTDKAKKAVQFSRAYRSYVFNYSLGEDVVRKWIGTGPDRRDRFFDLLSRPAVPSDLE